VLNGHYSWLQVLRDTFSSNHHSQLFPMLFQIVNAKWWGFSVYPPIYFGFFLACLKLFLLFRIFVWKIGMEPLVVTPHFVGPGVLGFSNFHL
jgi:hypothetical protein